MKTQDKKEMIQQLIRFDFDIQTSNLLAKDIIECAKSVQVDGQPLDEDFINQMEKDLKP